MILPDKNMPQTNIANLTTHLSTITKTTLQKPANRAQLDELLATYEHVPETLLELLAFANGEVDSSFKSNGMIAFEAFISASEIINEFGFATDSDLYVDLNRFVNCQRIDKSSQWHHGLIPISFGYDGHCVCIDMKPGQKGTPGQILGLQPTIGIIAVIAESLTDLLSKTLALYQEQQFEFSDPNSPNLTLADFPSIG